MALRFSQTHHHPRPAVERVYPDAPRYEGVHHDTTGTPFGGLQNVSQGWISPPSNIHIAPGQWDLRLFDMRR